MLSICIPLKNRAANLQRCLDSLEALTGIDEIVIGDFGSTDSGFMFLKHYKTPIKKINILGPFSVGKGKNVAAEHSRGDILFFLDVDLVTPQEVIDRILKLIPLGFKYAPVMWLEDEAGTGGEWASHSFGQIAVTRKDWEKHKWVEWSSYGGDDNLFYEPYVYTAIRDEVMDFVHKWHPHNMRFMYHDKPAGSDLDEYNIKTYGTKHPK